MPGDRSRGFTKPAAIATSLHVARLVALPGDRLEQKIRNEVGVREPEASAPRSHHPGARRPTATEGGVMTLRKMSPGGRPKEVGGSGDSS